MAEDAWLLDRRYAGEKATADATGKVKRGTRRCCDHRCVAGAAAQERQACEAAEAGWEATRESVGVQVPADRLADTSRQTLSLAVHNYHWCDMSGEGNHAGRRLTHRFSRSTRSPRDAGIVPLMPMLRRFLETQGPLGCWRGVGGCGEKDEGAGQVCARLKAGERHAGAHIVDTRGGLPEQEMPAQVQ